jgi:AcrR family transcriptional regulator
MARPAKFTDDDILDAALRQVTGGGTGATVAAIAAEVGAPTGSIYHRFASRDVLLARLWLRTVAEFQDQLVDVLAATDPVAAGRRAARFLLEWSRAHLVEAQLLLLHRREDLLVDGWPEEVRDRAAAVAEQFDDAMRDFTRRRLGSLSQEAQRRVAFAVVDIPFAALRRHLGAGEAPPLMLDDLVERAHDAVLEDR